jgi:hypothetical protein
VAESPPLLLHCTFCRKDADHVAKLVAGPGVFICDGCVDLAGRAMRGEAIPDFPGWASLSDEQLLSSLSVAAATVEGVEGSVRQQIGVLRDRGVTWARIGAALGMSRQAAWERFAGEE